MTERESGGALTEQGPGAPAQARQVGGPFVNAYVGEVPRVPDGPSAALVNPFDDVGNLMPGEASGCFFCRFRLKCV
jgi:hypothetical protein